MGDMLRCARVLQHVMARGIERQLLFRDEHDRQNFLRRVETLVGARDPSRAMLGCSSPIIFIYWCGRTNALRRGVCGPCCPASTLPGAFQWSATPCLTTQANCTLHQNTLAPWASEQLARMASPF